MYIYISITINKYIYILTNLYNSNQPILLLDLSNNKGVEYPSTSRKRRGKKLDNSSSSIFLPATRATKQKNRQAPGRGEEKKGEKGKREEREGREGREERRERRERREEVKKKVQIKGEERREEREGEREGGGGERG